LPGFRPETGRGGPAQRRQIVCAVAGIGYIHLSEFEQKTPQEVSDALARLTTPSLQGLVLDLRDNHGGVVDAAIGVASLFLKPDTLVMTVRGRSSLKKRTEQLPLQSNSTCP